MTKKLLAMALLAAGLSVGCGDEDELSPNARLDAAADGAADAPVLPGSDALPGVDAPTVDGAASEDAASVDAGSPDTATPDAGDEPDTGEAADGGNADAPPV